MRTNINHLGLLALAAMNAAFGTELHLILSSTNTNGLPHFEAAHAIVRGDGRVEVVEDLIKKTDANDPYDGLFWIDTNYSERKAVLLRTGNPVAQNNPEVIVLEFDAGRVTKRCKAGGLPAGLMGIHELLIDDPVHGLLYVDYAVGSTADQVVLAGVRLDGSVPCGESYPQLLRGVSMLQFVTDGSAGVSSTGSNNYMGAVLMDRRLRTNFGLDWHYFPFEIPQRLLDGLGSIINAPILARNRTIEVVALFTKEGSFRHLVHIRGGEEWKELPTNGSVPPKLRAFGDWIAWSEYGDAKVAARAAKAGLPVESPGSSEWRKENSRWGKADLYGLRGNNVINSGILHLYHAKTDQHLTMDTKQGDSEILLVEGESVYYRVLDRVYRASIGKAGITGRQLLAKSELIRDAHWAFLPAGNTVWDRK